MNQGGGGPGAGQVLAGIFLILFGLCGTLLGGGCTVLMVGVVFQTPNMDSGGLGFLLLSVAILVGGLAAIWAGIKLMTGRLR